MHKMMFACAGAMLVAAPAAAGPIVTGSADRVEVHVYHGDLDLQSEDGNRALKARVTAAARKMCVTPGPQPLSAWQDERACYSTAQADGFAQADAYFLAPHGSVIVETMLITGQ